jgi:hypothetical protein
MFGPVMVAGRWARERTPSILAALKPKLNFITLHCIYARIRRHGGDYG